MLFGRARQHLACDHERLFVGDGQPLAGLGGRQSRGQPGGAHHRGEHRVDAVALHQVDETALAGKDREILTVHQGSEPVHVLAAGHGDVRGLVPPDLLGQKLHVLVGAESDDAVLRPQGLDHAQCVSADRAGGTQNGDSPRHRYRLSTLLQCQGRPAALFPCRRGRSDHAAIVVRQHNMPCRGPPTVRAIV